MAKTVKDCTLNLGIHNKAEEVTDAKAVVLAIRNIILSRPGNYPQLPSLGLDIERYLGEFADSKTANDIKSNLDSQIATYMDGASIITTVEFKEADIIDRGLMQVLVINVNATAGDETVDTTFLIFKDGQELCVYNETF